jgi:SAM-dependent methyltransferase
MGTAQIQGELWGAKPNDWAEAQEPVQRPMYEAVFDALNIGRGTRLLDIGCGAGGALVIARERGAEVAGLDAAQSLVAVARRRLPGARIEVGEMEELPFPDAAFDVVTAFNAFQFAGDGARAVREAARVCRPGGTVAVLIWRPREESDIPRAIVPALAALMPAPPPNAPSPFAWEAPGHLEQMLEQAGLAISARGDVPCPFAYADVAAAWRANSAAAPFVRAVRHAGEERVHAAFQAAVAPFVRGDGSVLLTNKFRWVAARRKSDA